MLIGHFGIAQLGKGLRPGGELPLIALAVAAYLPDLVRAALWVSAPRGDMLSHSIPSVVLGAAVVAIAWRLHGGSGAAAAVLAAVCLLHWPADLLTGCKPTWPGGPWIGLIWYRRPVSDLVVELGIFVGSWVWLWRLGVFRRRAFARWMLAAGIALHIAFLGMSYRDAEFFIGKREWTWKPEVSLVPVRSTLEDLRCTEPES